MADYSKQIATAQRLISDKGMTVQYVLEIPTGERDSYNRPIVVEETFNVQAVKTNPSKEELEAGYPSESIILLVAGSEFSYTPSTKDKFQFNGKVWDINQIVEVAPAEQVILYKFVLLEKGEVE